jgi:hypothetical protein
MAGVNSYPISEDGLKHPNVLLPKPKQKDFTQQMDALSLMPHPLTQNAPVLR